MVKKEPRIINYYDGEKDFISTADGDADILTGLMVDVETTGLDSRKDKIIEIGLVSFQFDSLSGKITEVLKVDNFLQDPGQPLSAEIVKLTGLTDEILKDQSFDMGKIDSHFSNANIIIAHNARFDRGFIHQKFKSSSDKLWACSMDDVNWRSNGFGCRTLQHLCNDCLFYFEGHRAEIDCLATLKLLSNDRGGAIFLKELFDNAQKKEFFVHAVKAPFASKDMLKAARFRWDADNKVWYKKVSESEQKEINELMSKVYPNSPQHVIKELSLSDRFLT